MLAYIPPTTSRQSDHTPAPLPANNNMSLAILPSAPMSYSLTPASGPTVMPTNAPSPSKRPKLSLNTSSGASLFGKKATSLRLETLSATSPTAVNTFSNGYENDPLLKTPGTKLQRPSLTPIATNLRSSTPSPTESGPNVSSPEATSSSATSTTSCSTVDSYQPTEIPYKPSYSVTSILTNGPYPKTRYSRMAFSQSRPMFPAAKRVSFRAPLTEDIHTSKYVLAHSDIESSTSTISTLQLATTDNETADGTVDSNTKMTESPNDISPQRSPNAEQRIASSPPTHSQLGQSEDEDSDSDVCPATPVAGKRKRHRQWRWTLGPLQNSSDAPSSPSSSSSPSSVTTTASTAPDEEQQEKTDGKAL